MSVPVHYGYNWWIGTEDQNEFEGTLGNDTFQLAGSESYAVGGVNNDWDTYHGGAGWDRIYVAPKYYYYWTAIMIRDDGSGNGLDDVESIIFGTSGPKPIYFTGSVNFGDVVSMATDVKIYGRGDNNTFNGGVLGEHAEGDAGNDTLYGNDGDDFLYGDTWDNPWAVSWAAAGDDQLFGGNGDDKLFGQGGDDVLQGNAGNDILDGGAGGNHLWGGAGDDEFQVTDTMDSSRIEDFSGGAETITFSDTIADDFLDLFIFDDVNGDANITVGSVHLIVTGYNSASLSASDFAFGIV